MELFSYLKPRKTLAFSSFNLKENAGESEQLISNYFDSVPTSLNPERLFQFSEERKLEFVLGRLCVKEALLKMFERMGKKSESKCFNVGVNSDRSPSWH